VDQVEQTRDAVATGSVEAARQLDVFLGRIGDLTIEELRELYDETFRKGGPNEIGSAVRRLAHSRASHQEIRAGLDELAPLLERLDADRNPFAYVVRALCCVLLTSFSPSRAERLSQ
jgi:nitrate reductase assembly molybdenum cofactor insertion protein NarJ